MMKNNTLPWLCTSGATGVLEPDQGPLLIPKLRSSAVYAKMDCPNPKCREWNHAENDACVYCDTPLPWTTGTVRSMQLKMGFLRFGTYIHHAYCILPSQRSSEAIASVASDTRYVRLGALSNTEPGYLPSCICSQRPGNSNRARKPEVPSMHPNEC